MNTLPGELQKLIETGRGELAAGEAAKAAALEKAEAEYNAEWEKFFDCVASQIPATADLLRPYMTRWNDDECGSVFDYSNMARAFIVIPGLAPIWLDFTRGDKTNWQWEQAGDWKIAGIDDYGSGPIYSTERVCYVETESLTESLAFAEAQATRMEQRKREYERRKVKEQRSKALNTGTLESRLIEIIREIVRDEIGNQ